MPTLTLVVLWLIGLATMGCSAVTPYCQDHTCYPDVLPTQGGENIDHRILLIGDAGAPATSGEPVLSSLAHQASFLPEKTTVLFLGDNIYEGGLPNRDAEDWPEAKRRLDAQIDVIRKSHARGIFIPGNHDWDAGGPEGWDRINNLGQYMKTLASDEGLDVSLLPEGGCPGPEVLPLGDYAVVVILDTQWWLHDTEKPNPDTPAGCRHTTEQAVLDALKAHLLQATQSQRHIILAAHHPLNSHGAHTQFSDAKIHLFPMTDLHHHLWIPLPILGSVVAGMRSVRSPWIQDFSNPQNEHMRHRIQGVLTDLSSTGIHPLAFVAGHDHSLQVLEGEEDVHYHLISGAGSESKITRVEFDEDTLFAHSHTGFMEVTFRRSGRVELFVMEPRDTAQDLEMVFTRCLAQCGEEETASRF